MPLNPSPEEVTTLEFTLSNVLVSRWDDGDQRELVITPYSIQNSMVLGTAGPYEEGTVAYWRSVEICTSDEMWELIDAIKAQSKWLSYNDEPRDWVVSWMHDTADGPTPRVRGGFTRVEADEWATELVRNHGESVDVVAVTKLETEDRDV